MGKLILKIVALLIILLGVILIYDARMITKKFFSFGDQNEGSSGLKILGFIFAIIGGIIIYFCNWKYAFYKWWFDKFIKMCYNYNMPIKIGK